MVYFRQPVAWKIRDDVIDDYSDYDITAVVKYKVSIWPIMVYFFLLITITSSSKLYTAIAACLLVKVHILNIYDCLMVACIFCKQY